jgi:hypothetical protein
VASTISDPRSLARVSGPRRFRDQFCLVSPFLDHGRLRYDRGVPVKGYSTVSAVVLRVFTLSGLAVSNAQVEGVPTSVADILANRAKLNGAVVVLDGELGLGAELNYFSDQSHCKGSAAKPCKLDFTVDKCRISGTRYFSMECGEAIRRLLAEAGFAFPLRGGLVVVKGVSISGTLATRRSVMSFGKQPPPPYGFGHLGTFPAQINATIVNLDRAEVHAGESPPRVK